MSGVINYQFRLNGVLIFKIELLIYYYVWYTNQCFMLYKVILAVVDCGPQTQKLAECQLTITCKLAGFQHSEIGSSISTDNASWRATNSEAGGKSASMNIIKKLGNKMLPNFIFKIINPI